MSRERATAIGAVRAASAVCQRVRGGLVQAVRKQDNSPVTVADFASQAIICRAIRASFPDDPIVAEEDAGELRGPVLKQAADHAQMGEAELVKWIDAGRLRQPAGRFWTVDPIDGTKGFLRGGQYAVALALIDGGQVVLGVLGCPNLRSTSGGGVMLAAERGDGVLEYALEDETGQGVRPASSSSPRFCESVESGHTDQRLSARIAQALGIVDEPLRMDSQTKYAAVARGDAAIYLRLPTSGEYRERIWDHAAGAIIVQEAGGRVTDIFGRELDFSSPPALRSGGGVVASRGVDHARIIQAIAEARD